MKTERYLEDRVRYLELHFAELNDLLIEIWGHFQPPSSPEEQVLVGKLMKLCRDLSEEIYERDIDYRDQSPRHYGANEIADLIAEDDRKQQEQQ